MSKLRPLLSIFDACQQSKAACIRQINLLTIIFHQARLHQRTIHFELGNTRRTHTFREHETVCCPAVWGTLLDASKKTINRDINSLLDLKVISTTEYDGWRSIEHFVDDNVSFGTQLDRLNVALANTLKSELKLCVTDFCPTASDNLLFLFNINSNDKGNLFSKDIPLNKNRTSDALGQKRNRKSKGKPKTACLRTIPASELRKQRTLENTIVESVINFNNALSELPTGILGRRPRRDAIARKVYSKWRQIFGKGGRSILRDFVVEKESQDRIISALLEAKMVHGSKWLTFEWLLSFPKHAFREDMNNEPNLAKLLDGEYATIPEWLEQKRLHDERNQVATETCNPFE